MFDPTNIEHPYGVSDASSACKILRTREQGEQKWPALLQKNLNPLNEITKDGKIVPEEFDYELANLTKDQRKKLMEDVMKHPLVYTSG